MTSSFTGRPKLSPSCRNISISLAAHCPLSHKMTDGLIVPAVAAGDYFRHAARANDFHKFFELDSPRNFLHTRITSQPALFASPAKLLFACQPCCGAQFVLTPLISTTI
jgi:hypothetical protein